MTQLHSFCPHPTQPPSDPGFLTLSSSPIRLLLPHPVSYIHSLTKNCFCSQPPSTQSPMGCVINSSSMSLFLTLLHLSAPLDEFSEEGIRILSLDLHPDHPARNLCYTLSPSFPDFVLFLQDSIYHTGYTWNMSMYMWQSLLFPVWSDADGSFFFALLSL